MGEDGESVTKRSAGGPFSVCGSVGKKALAAGVQQPKWRKISGEEITPLKSIEVPLCNVCPSTRGCEVGWTFVNVQPTSQKKRATPQCPPRGTSANCGLLLSMTQRVSTLFPSHSADGRLCPSLLLLLLLTSCQ